MINTILKLAAAASLVAVCSITETQAQQLYGNAIPPMGRNHGGSYSGYGNYTYNNNCTGCYPGSGPYDSQIAVTGIAAGAAVLNGLIGAVVQSQRQPQVVVVPQQSQGCRYVQVGNDTQGRPLFTCQ